MGEDYLDPMDDLDLTEEKSMSNSLDCLDPTSIHKQQIHQRVLEVLKITKSKNGMVETSFIFSNYISSE
jgi:hypothetical protein